MSDSEDTSGEAKELLSSLSLQYDESKHILLATLQAKADAEQAQAPLSRDSLMDLIAEEGYSNIDLLYNENNISQLLSQAQADTPPTAPFAIDIAKKNTYDGLHSTVSLYMLESQNQLMAKMNFKDSSEPFELANLEQLILEEGFSDLQRIDENIDELLTQLKANDRPLHPFKIAIAERIDAKCYVEFANDKMEASLVVERPYGGEYINKDMIDIALKSKGVTKGIFVHVYDVALGFGDKINKEGKKSWTIARGKAPIDGKDSQFIPLFDNLPQRKTPLINEEGRADFREREAIFTVKPNTRLMKLLPPTKGIHGYNVLGEVRHAQDGILYHYRADLKGVKPSDSEPNILVATDIGMPVVVDDGVIVEQIHRVEHVDIHSGNIHFDGSVYISGNVAEGMKIIASGDIHVEGTVEASYLQAGGDVVIHKSVLGRPTPSENIHKNVSHQIKNWDMRIIAAGVVKVRSCLNTAIEAEKSIIIDESAMHSLLISHNDIVIDEDEKGAGLIGGYAKAVKSLTSSCIGSKGFVKTIIDIGIGEAKAAEVEKNLHDKIKEREKALLSLRDNLHRLKETKDKALFAERIAATIVKYQKDIKDCRQELEDYANHIKEVNESVMIKAKEQLYAGVTLFINGTKRRVTAITAPGEFHYKEGQIYYIMDE